MIAPSNIVPLPVWPLPKQGESLLGLLLRATDLCTLGSPSQMMNSCGVEFDIGSLPYTTSAAQPLAALLRANPEDILATMYGRPDGTTVVMGHPLHPEHVSVMHRRLCPHCLAEDGDGAYQRALWDLSVMWVCPRHGVRLVSHCPDCGSKLGWRFPSVWQCRCGTDLRYVGVEAVPQRDLTGVQAISAMFAGEGSGALYEALGASEALRLILLLGQIASGVSVRRKPLAFSLGHQGEVHRILDRGWRICADWPHSFHDFLGRLRQRAASHKGRYGLAKQFGSLPQLLWNVRDTPHGKFALDALVAYAASVPDLATRALGVRKRRAEVRHADECITLALAADILKLGHGSLRQFADEHRLIVAGEGGKGGPLLLRRAAVIDIRRQLGALADQDQAWKLLGIAKRTFVDLREAGLIPAPCDTPVSRLKGDRVWAVADLEQWVQRLSGTVQRRIGQRHLTLDQAARKLSNLGIGSARILQAVLNGTLPVAGLAKRGKGLARLRFGEKDVAAFHDNLVFECRPTLSVDAAAKRLGVKQEVAYEWVRLGLLPTVNVAGNRAELGRRVLPADIAHFQALYVTAGELRRMGLGTSKKLALQLIDQGLRPVSGPTVDGARQYLFSRAEVQVLLDAAGPACNS